MQLVACRRIYTVSKRSVQLCTPPIVSRARARVCVCVQLFSIMGSALFATGLWLVKRHFLSFSWRGMLLTTGTLLAPTTPWATTTP